MPAPTPIDRLKKALAAVNDCLEQGYTDDDSVVEQAIAAAEAIHHQLCQEPPPPPKAPACSTC